MPLDENTPGDSTTVHTNAYIHVLNACTHIHLMYVLLRLFVTVEFRFIVKLKKSSKVLLVLKTVVTG